jgi:chemotaxis protein MotB
MISPKRRQSADAEEVNYFISVSDLMAGALMIVLLMLAGYVVSKIEEPSISMDQIAVTPPAWQEPVSANAYPLTFQLSVAPRKEQIIRCRTQDVTAIAGADYLPVNAYLVFQPGQTQANLEIVLLPDALVEGTEEFKVILTGPSGINGGTREISIHILDIDADTPLVRPPTLTLRGGRIEEPAQGSATLPIVAELDRKTIRPVIFEVTTEDGTATQNADYVSEKSRVVRFLPGETKRSIDITVLPDRFQQEGTEYFFLNVSSPVDGAILGDGRSRIEIIDRIVPDEPLSADERVEAIFKKVESDRIALLNRIKASMERQVQGLVVDHDEINGILRFPSSLLFDPNKAQLKKGGPEVLELLGQCLNEEIQRHASDPWAHQLDAIYIEGHTDADKIKGGEFKDNTDLSAQRATNSYRAILAGAPGLTRLKNKNGKALFSVSGYGEERPLNPNPLNDDEKQVNRRIDFRFVMARPPLEMLRTGGGIERR